MNKYIIIDKGSRGFVEDVEVVESSLSIVEISNELFYKKTKEMRGNCSDKEELEDLEIMLEEFGYVIKVDDYYEVCISEEEYFEVYKVDINI